MSIFCLILGTVIGAVIGATILYRLSHTNSYQYCAGFALAIVASAIPVWFTLVVFFMAFFQQYFEASL